MKETLGYTKADRYVIVNEGVWGGDRVDSGPGEEDTRRGYSSHGRKSCTLVRRFVFQRLILLGAAHACNPSV